MTLHSSSEELVRLRAGEIDPGALVDTHLARVLAVLERERATGVLEVEAGEQHTGFYLREGVPVFAEAGTVGETLGRVLVAERVITAAQYGAILRRMTDALVHDELMRFGEVAVELGILSPEQVSAGLGRQVRAKLVRCLQLDRARWVFRDDPDAVARVARFPCPLAPALLEALAEPAESARWVARLAPFSDRYAAIGEDAATVAQRLALPPSGLRVARALDGSRPLGAIVQPTEKGAEQRAATVAALLLLEVASFRIPAARVPTIPERTPERPPAPTPSEPRADPQAELDAAARAATVAATLRAEFDRRRAALSSRSAPQQRQEQRSRLTAEQHYAEGRKHLREGKIPLAQRELVAAADQMPDAIEYRLAASLATWLASDDATERTTQEDILREHLAATMKADRRCALAHYVQGRLHAAASDHAAALKSFQIASKLDPEEVEFQRWTRVTRARAK